MRSGKEINAKFIQLTVFLLLFLASGALLGQNRLLKKAYKQTNENNWVAFEETMNKYKEKGGKKNALYHSLYAKYYEAGYTSSHSGQTEAARLWYDELVSSFSALKNMPDDEQSERCTDFELCLKNEQAEVLKAVEALYKEYEKPNTISKWREFINSYGSHSIALKHSAEKNIEKLAFNDALTENSERSYKTFIQDYPSASSEMRAQAFKNWEELAYQRVISSNKKTGYNEFLDAFPNTSHKGEVQAKIEYLDYKLVAGHETMEAVNDFLDTYPDSKHKEKLVEALGEKVKQTLDVDQMDAFISQFPFCHKINEIKASRDWVIETDSLIQKTQDILDEKIEYNLLTVNQDKNGVTIKTRANTIRLKNNAGNRDPFDMLHHSYAYFLPVIKSHYVFKSGYEWHKSILINDYTGTETELGYFEYIRYFLRHKRNIFFISSVENPYADKGYGMHIYSFNIGQVKPHICNDNCAIGACSFLHGEQGHFCNSRCSPLKDEDIQIEKLFGFENAWSAPELVVSDFDKTNRIQVNFSGYGAPKQFVLEYSSLSNKWFQVFTDVDGNTLMPVQIGAQVWMAANLNVSHFRNGDPIPHAKTNKEWNRAGENKEPAWCYYDNDTDNGEKYGKLYNWYAVNDPRGLAPDGWRIPDDYAFQMIETYLGDGAGTKMKSKDGWSQNGNGTNESGFSGLSGGYRDNNGNFNYVGSNGYWWTDTYLNSVNAYNWGLKGGNSDLYHYYDYKERGLSVRCVRD